MVERLHQQGFAGTDAAPANQDKHTTGQWGGRRGWNEGEAGAFMDGERWMVQAWEGVGMAEEVSAPSRPILSLKALYGLLKTAPAIE